MYGYIYKTTNKLNGKIYVGRHKYSEFDTKYYGSGILLTEAIATFGIDNFYCELIDTAESEAELNDKEIYWISKLNSQDPFIGYNISSGGYYDGVMNMLSPENYAKFIKLRSDCCKNSHWWTDSVNERFLPECPEGWTKGRCPTSVRRLQNQSPTVSGKVWITNDVEERYIDSGVNLPEGWHYGRIPGKTAHRTTAAWNKGIPNEKLKNTKWVCNESERRQVPIEEVDKFLEAGWQIGMRFKKNMPKDVFITDVRLPAGKDVNDLSYDEVTKLINLS